MAKGQWIAMTVAYRWQEFCVQLKPTLVFYFSIRVQFVTLQQPELQCSSGKFNLIKLTFLSFEVLFIGIKTNNSTNMRPINIRNLKYLPIVYIYIYFYLYVFPWSGYSFYNMKAQPTPSVYDSKCIIGSRESILN